MLDLRSFVACLVLATSGLVPGLPNLVRSAIEAGIGHVRGASTLVEHDPDCAAKNANGECDGCPLTCTRCACLMPRALATEPKIALTAPIAAIDLITTPYRSPVSKSLVVSIFHPPRA